MDQIALGKRIKAARERVGMTQEDLAAAVDYSVDHVSVVERGVKPPIWMRQRCFTPQSSPSD